MQRRVAYITDIHLEEAFPAELGVDSKSNWIKVLNDVRSRNIKEIVFGGDIGGKTAHTWFFDSLKDYKLSITLGNHDSFNEVIHHFKNEISASSSELYYSKQDDFFKYIFLDSSTEKLSDAQLDWLKKELQTDKKIILFIHHPILEVDTAIDKRFALKEREKITKILQSCKNSITVFTGHYHMEDEVIKDNVQQYISPASSYLTERNSDKIKVNGQSFGYRIVELNNNQINTEVILFKSSKGILKVI